MGNRKQQMNVIASDAKSTVTAYSLYHGMSELIPCLLYSLPMHGLPCPRVAKVHARITHRFGIALLEKSRKCRRLFSIDTLASLDPNFKPETFSAQNEWNAFVLPYFPQL